MRDIEYKILSKYISGEDLDEKDRPFLEKYQSIGFVARFGFSFERETETAVLTEKGKRAVYHEKIFRNPVRRFFHNWKVCLVR
ncbi:MAG: hypothetical protein KKF67_02785 [Nanoarchaeota archaeon]|nr:hypothetical protein [Nanoarchaeota archaeon]